MNEHESKPASAIEIQAATEELDKIRAVDAENAIGLPALDEISFVMGFIAGWNNHHQVYPEDSIRQITTWLEANR